MAYLCQVSIIGNVGRDPETKYTQNGDMYVTFSVATTRKWSNGYGQLQEKTTWFKCTAWGKLAETMDGLAQRGGFKKGVQVYVDGQLDDRAYTDQSGLSRVSLDVRVDKWQILGTRQDNMQPNVTQGNRALQAQPPQQQPQQQYYQAGDDPGFEDDNFEADLSGMAHSPFNRM